MSNEALTTRTKTYNEIAYEAAVAAFDAHGNDMPVAAVAYEFIADVYAEDGIDLPSEMPYIFLYNYKRYRRGFQQRNRGMIQGPSQTEYAV